MALFIIKGIVGATQTYYTDRLSNLWSRSIKQATTFKTKQEADEAMQSIINEEEESIELRDDSGQRMTSFYAPQQLRELVRVRSNNIKADVKIQLCALSLVPLDTERWHVEDGFGKTKRLS